MKDQLQENKELLQELEPENIEKYAFFKKLGLIREEYYDEVINNISKLLLSKKNLYDNFVASLEEKHRKTIDLLEKENNNKINGILNEYNIKEKEKADDLGPPIVSKQFLGIENYHIQQFNQFLEVINKNLSDEQKEILYTGHPAVNIRAGAGAGKSTVLALRIVFMVVRLNISLERITASTFTVASRADLVGKIMGHFEAYGRPITKLTARSIIRTFHSVAYEVNQTLGGGHKKIIFGDKTPKIPEDDKYGASIEVTEGVVTSDKGEYEDPSVILPLTKILNDTYKSEYDKAGEFKSLIDQLYISHKQKDKYREMYRHGRADGDDYARKIEAYDECLREYCWNSWSTIFPEAFAKAQEYMDFGEHQVGAFTLNYHLYLENINAMVFLSLENSSPIYDYDISKELVSVSGYGDSKLCILLNTKRLVAFNRASLNYMVVTEGRDLEWLINQDKYAVDAMPQTRTALEFSYQCSGELLKKQNPCAMFCLKP